MATTQQSKMKLEKMKEAEVKAEWLGVKAEVEEEMKAAAAQGGEGGGEAAAQGGGEGGEAAAQRGGGEAGAPRRPACCSRREASHRAV
jgi:hypothetical protein